ncbi:MAG: TrmB family transcriptional regulator [Candidatus Nezhaarchaeales archaeon]
MSITPIEESLEKAGLTLIEAKIYLFLNENPRKSEDEISAALGINLQELKEALSSLKAKGLVKTVDQDTYDVTPPSKALEILLDIKAKYMESELANTRRQLSSIREVLENKYWESRYGIRDELLLEPLDDLKSMEVKTVRLISEAQREIRIFTASFEWYTKIREVLLDAVRRGVKVKILMRVVDEHSQKRARDLLENGIEVKSTVEDWYPVRGTIVDGNKLLFLIWATEKKLSYYKPHYTENVGLIKIFLDAFERRWERASNIE